MKVITRGFRRGRSRGVMGVDPVTIRVVAPKPDFHAAEGIDVIQSPRTDGRREDDNRLMGEVTIAHRLDQRPSPIVQLAFKSASGWASLLHEIRHAVLLDLTGIRADHDEVRNAIPVDRDLPGSCDGFFSRIPVDRRKITEVGTSEGNGEPILGGRHPLSTGEVVPRLTEFEFWNRDCHQEEAPAGANHMDGLPATRWRLLGHGIFPSAMSKATVGAWRESKEPAGHLSGVPRDAMETTFNAGRRGGESLQFPDSSRFFPHLSPSRLSDIVRLRACKPRPMCEVTPNRPATPLHDAQLGGYFFFRVPGKGGRA